jgi:hypothetical protein
MMSTVLWCCAAVIFTMDIIVTFCTGLVIVHNLRQAVVMDRKIVAKHYLLHGTLAIDVLATGPLWVEVRSACRCAQVLQCTISVAAV